MDPMRRGNYDSGQDYVLEYGELRFTFNERDFSERVEQAARKLGFVGGRLDPTELEDLVNLAVNGEIQDPASALGEHVNDCWPELVGPGRPLARALAAPPRLPLRLARPAGQGRRARRRLRRGDAHVRLRAARARSRADRALTRAELAPGRVLAAASAASSVSARALAIASAPASPTSSSGCTTPEAARSTAGKRPSAVSACVERDHRRLAAERRRGGRDHGQRPTVDDVARRRQRAARGAAAAGTRACR